MKSERGRDRRRGETKRIDCWQRRGGYEKNLWNAEKAWLPEFRERQGNKLL